MFQKCISFPRILSWQSKILKYKSICNFSNGLANNKYVRIYCITLAFFFYRLGFIQNLKIREKNIADLWVNMRKLFPLNFSSSCETHTYLVNTSTEE